MIRLDKFLSQMNIGSRSEVKSDIKKGRVSINGQICKNPDEKIDESLDVVCFNGSIVTYEKYVYYMLNKPSGVVSATKDNFDKNVMELLEGVNCKDVFPVGRLDKDTEGLLLITNDGELSHNLLSPKKHISKTYRVLTKADIDNEQIIAIEKGVDIGEGIITLPATIQKIDSREIILTIFEGKFHQVKRMLKSVGNEVVYLERIKMGKLELDKSLKRGEFRKLSEREVELLKKEK